MTSFDLSYIEIAALSEVLRWGVQTYPGFISDMKIINALCEKFTDAHIKQQEGVMKNGISKGRKAFSKRR